MKKKILVTLLTLTTLFCFTGCEYEVEEVNVDTETASMDVNTPTLDNIPTLDKELAIPDEDFTLLCTYDTSGYDLSKWHVTDSKTIGMKVKTNNLPEDYEVYIDHVHADISLKFTSLQINGMPQDSMEDTFHGQSQDGFYINNTDEYYNVFSIEGYTDQFYQLWGYAFGNYGTVSSKYQRLTENSIIGVGTYAEKLSVVYDISIKKPNSNKVYTKSVSDSILIPVSQDPETTTVIKNTNTESEN